MNAKKGGRKMFLINASYLNGDFQLVQGDIEIEEGKIKRLGESFPAKRRTWRWTAGAIR